MTPAQTCAADRLGPAARRDRDPGALPARPRDGGDGRPRRDPDLVGDPRLPGQPQYLGPAAAGWPTPTRCSRTTSSTNQNHPSILLWSIGNELPTPVTAAEARYIAGAAALANKLDPTRPVGMAVSNWPGVACQSAYAPLDVIGDNEYFGWFDAGGGGDDDRDALGPVPGLRPRLLSDQGDDGHRVRLRRQPRRPGRGARHIRVPVRLGRLPPGRVRVQAVAVRRDVLRAPGLRGVPGVLGRRPAARPAVQPEGSWSTQRAGTSRRSRWCRRSTPRRRRADRAPVGPQAPSGRSHSGL